MTKRMRSIISWLRLGRYFAVLQSRRFDNARGNTHHKLTRHQASLLSKCRALQLCSRKCTDRRLAAVLDTDISPDLKLQQTKKIDDSFDLLYLPNHHPSRSPSSSAASGSYKSHPTMTDAAPPPAATGQAAPELSSLAETFASTNLSSPLQHDDTSSTLSRRGAVGSQFKLPEGFRRLLANMYDPVTNPTGIINAGIADNSLCRTELLEFFLAKDRLHLSPADMTYANRLTSSTRLLEAIASLFNDYKPDWPEGDASPLPIKKVEVDHIAIASGATGVLDELFWNLCDEGDGVLLSAPYYNAFDNDLTNRAKAKIVQVNLPGSSEDSSAVNLFTASTVQAYEEAYATATSSGIPVKALLLCNPHNPTGTIYPRSTVIALAKFAASHHLHFVSDEIYARSTFPTSTNPHPPLFESILSIDVRKECGLDPAYVHVVTSASKDFAVNGFRLGVLVTQHNAALQRAMASIGSLSQSASPAASLWTTLLQDQKFLKWYFRENRRRLSLAYQHSIEFFEHHSIPYWNSNAGFFLMINLRKYCGITQDMDEQTARAKEAKFLDKLIDGGVLISPGTIYHFPTPGWFRFTFSQNPKTLKLTFDRLEKVMGVEGGESCEAKRGILDFGDGEEKVGKGAGRLKRLMSR
ncbi:aspartate aminotransferase [Pseudozyma hubeiensis SY62]|uniref:Aspartate aminotransferase n=1 Tax=Pseudozyma hubeiensis (strain SY62) TaxID=1305764 RepID=R9P0I2_PSEHS|nr:aspartate aminotransferase [Pseudozyma hubeiensis SY62]GAC94651.1 aspartate aminotransferase [Pseudozyma hubeiensis SY62]